MSLYGWPNGKPSALFARKFVGNMCLKDGKCLDRFAWRKSSFAKSAAAKTGAQDGGFPFAFRLGQVYPQAQTYEGPDSGGTLLMARKSTLPPGASMESPGGCLKIAWIVNSRITPSMRSWSTSTGPLSSRPASRFGEALLWSLSLTSGAKGTGCRKEKGNKGLVNCVCVLPR